MHFLFSIRLFALVAQRQLIMCLNKQGGGRTSNTSKPFAATRSAVSLHTLSVSVHAARWAQDAGSPRSAATKEKWGSVLMVANSVDALPLVMWSLAVRILAICSSHGVQGIMKVLWKPCSVCLRR